MKGQIKMRYISIKITTSQQMIAIIIIKINIIKTAPRNNGFVFCCHRIETNSQWLGGNNFSNDTQSTVKCHSIGRQVLRLPTQRCWLLPATITNHTFGGSKSKLINKKKNLKKYGERGKISNWWREKRGSLISPTKCNFGYKFPARWKRTLCQQIKSFPGK